MKKIKIRILPVESSGDSGSKGIFNFNNKKRKKNTDKKEE